MEGFGRNAFNGDLEIYEFSAAHVRTPERKRRGIAGGLSKWVFSCLLWV